MPPHLLNWDDHRTFTTQRLQCLSDFLKSVQVSFREYQVKAKAELDQAFATAEPIRDIETDEAIDDFTKVSFYYSGHLQKFHHEIPRLLNYSCIIQLYALFEDRGRALCKELKERDATIPLKVTDLVDKGDFESIRLFISKLCNVEYLYWSDLHLLRKIRNRLVHHDGHMPDTPELKSLLTQISSTKGVRVDNDRYLLVFPEYIDHAFQRVSQFFETVFEARKFGSKSLLSSTSLPDHGAILIDQSSGKTVVTLVSDFGDET